MPTFQYVAKESSGKTVKGKVQASGQTEALEALRKKKLKVTKLNVAPAKKAGSINLTPPKPKKGELEIFTRQLATMVSAGIPLLECMEILAEQAESPAMKSTMTDVIDDIRGGSDLSIALSRHPRIFGQIYVSMVRAGEASGQLDEILTRLADYIEASARLKREIKSAMTYPVVSLFLVFGITIFLMVGIVPKFKEIFDGLGVELPGVTKTVMGASLYMKEHFEVLMVGCVASFFGFIFWKKTKSGAAMWDAIVLRLPIFGDLFRKVALSRFARTFSTMIKSGVPILGSLEIVAATSGNAVIRRAVEGAMDSVRQGESLATPLAKEAVFPPMVVKMIGIGERSGALETLLEKISEFYDQQVEASVKALTSLIEPLLIAVMGGLVGGIVLAVFLPILKLQEALTPGG